MQEDRIARVGTRAALALLGIASVLAAIVPGDAWAPGSSGLASASEITTTRTLTTSTGLTVAPIDGGAMIATGDGGGAGPILGIDHPLRVRAAVFRDADAWEIGSAPGRPATYVDDNGVRLDDGMLDRLRVRAPVPIVIALLALALRRSRFAWRVRGAAALWAVAAVWLLVSAR